MQVIYTDENSIVVKCPGNKLDTLELSDDYALVIRQRVLKEKDKVDLVNVLINNLWKTKKAREKRHLQL